MSQHKRKGEILAPAGSIEQLIASVNNGCDSVYLGLDAFNARMKAPNFTSENIKQWTDYCHLFGVKVYVAINTSIKNSEFAQAVEMLKKVYLSNVDGVILTDLALIKFASQLPKPFDIVASTQLNVHDGFGAQLLKDCGATTVVCARECSLDEIRDVASTGVNVECFIHGATCVCQSGQCLFSAMVGGNSGNRGLCAQPCRKLYSIDDGISWGYMLSARDLCGLDNAQKLHENGVGVYKIEGRNRRAEYAGITSRIYRNLFDNNFQYSQDDFDSLAEMYNRDMTVLSYLSGDNVDIISTNCPNHIGVKVGYVKGNGFVAEKEINKGDGLKIFDNGKEVCGAIATSGGSGFVRAEFSGEVRDGMVVRRTTSTKLSDDVLHTTRKLPISVSFVAFSGKRAEITVVCNGTKVKYTSDFVVPNALKTPTSKQEIAQQLQKTGELYNTITDIAIQTDDIFLAKSQINDMRRCALDLLTQAIIDKYNSQFADRYTVNFEDIFAMLRNDVTNLRSNATKDCNDILSVTCYNVEMMQQAKSEAKYLIYKPEVIDTKSLKEAMEYGAFVDIPSFSDNKFLFTLLSQTKAGIVCQNVGHIQLARQIGLLYIAGSGLNIYNDYIASQFADAVTFIYSQELTLKEISQFALRNGLTFVDGQIALMKAVHCPYKVAYKCNCSDCQAHRGLKYTDELGNAFTFVRRKDGRCSFELLNGKKISVANRLKHSGRYLVDFDKDVIEHYVSINKGKDDNYIEKQPYTKGNLYTKVN